MKRRLLAIGAVITLLLVSFAAGRYLSAPAKPGTGGSPQPGAAAIEKLLTTAFTDPAGRPATLSHLRGKPLIVNFWATWCPPCLQEMPVFSRLQEKHPNVQFVGIAADTAENVREFSAKHKLSYPLLVASDGAIPLMAELGNNRNGLPFTLSIDANGQPRHAKLGGLSESETESIIADLSK